VRCSEPGYRALVRTLAHRGRRRWPWVARDMDASPPEWYLAPHLSEGDRRISVFVSCAGCRHLFIAAASNVPTLPRYFYPHPRETEL